MLRSDIEKVVAILRENNGPENAILDFEQMLQSYNGEEFDLINKNSCVATILWYQEDIVNGINAHSYKPTKENVAKVMNCLSRKSLEDCSDGWEVIHQAIGEALTPSVENEVFRTIKARLKTPNETVEFVLPIETDVLKEKVEELTIDSIEYIVCDGPSEIVDFLVNRNYSVKANEYLQMVYSKERIEANEIDDIDYVNEHLLVNQNIYSEDGLKHYLSALTYIAFDFIKLNDLIDYRASCISDDIYNEILSQLELSEDETLEGISIVKTDEKIILKVDVTTSDKDKEFEDFDISDLVYAFAS